MPSYSIFSIFLIHFCPFHPIPFSLSFSFIFVLSILLCYSQPFIKTTFVSSPLIPLLIFLHPHLSSSLSSHSSSFLSILFHLLLLYPSSFSVQAHLFLLPSPSSFFFLFIHVFKKSTHVPFHSLPFSFINSLFFFLPLLKSTLSSLSLSLSLSCHSPDLSLLTFLPVLFYQIQFLILSFHSLHVYSSLTVTFSLSLSFYFCLSVILSFFLTLYLSLQTKKKRNEGKEMHYLSLDSFSSFLSLFPLSTVKLLNEKMHFLSLSNFSLSLSPSVSLSLSPFLFPTLFSSLFFLHFPSSSFSHPLSSHILSYSFSYFFLFTSLQNFLPLLLLLLPVLHLLFFSPISRTRRIECNRIESLLTNATNKRNGSFVTLFSSLLFWFLSFSFFSPVSFFLFLFLSLSFVCLYFF